MTKEHWQQVKEIFHAALEVAPAERADFLDKACSGRDVLRREVESLIDSHEREGSFIDVPAYERAAHLLLSETTKLQDGLLIGHYRILKKIGRGGMGEVYLAKDQKLGRNVALKVLPGHFNGFTDRLRRFELEACAASALNHPNILTIYEVGQADSRHYIVTEYIEGETLRQRVPSEGMKIAAALDIAIQVASALAAAHEAGIIHRDIKPENIMIRRDQIVKVLDFGLAKLAGEGIEHDEESPTRPMLKTDSGVVMGTVQYMSPEQARGLSVDARTDIWSLGVVLYECISGRVPFEGETSSHTIVSILEDETPSLKDFKPDAPAELEWIVTKALRKERDERYQTSKELLGDLKELKHKLLFKAELERNAATKAGRESSEIKKAETPAMGDAAVAETIRIEAARTTSSYEILSRSIKRNWRWALLALAAPLVAAAVVFAGYKFIASRQTSSAVQNNSNTPQTTVPIKGKQVTSWSGLDIFPSFSPDGNSIAYSSDHNGSFEIYVKQLTPGGREIQLTSDGQQNLQPVWSPDGQRIIYHSHKRGGLWIVSSLGGTPKQLTVFGSRPAWSPDGALIAFQSQSFFDPQINSPGIASPSAVWVVPVAGGPPAQITKDDNPVGAQGAPFWSPDGKRIGFVVVNSGTIGSSLWSVARDGSDLKPLGWSKKKGGPIVDPVYAPDGKSIYFTGVTGGRTWGVLKLPVSPETGDALGEPVIIKETGWTIYKYLKVSADGKKIILSATDMTSNLYSVTVSPATGETKGAPLLLTQDTAFRKSNPAFSPDGKRVAYQKFTIGGNHDIWLMDADGKNQTQLTTDPDGDVFPNWLPQGDKVIYLPERPGQQKEVRAIDIQTGREEHLLNINRDISFPALSPDGKLLAFNSLQDGVTNVWTVALDTGELKQLTFGKDSTGFPHWSPDGMYLSFENRQGDSSHIMIMPRDGGEATQLNFETGQSFPGAWSPDGNRISFAGDRSGVWNIWWVSREGQTEKQITNYTKLNAFVRYPIWSPLGNQIVYEYAEITGNIWIMDLE